MVIFDYTILLRPFGGKICLWQTACVVEKLKNKFFIFLLLAVRDFALMSLDMNGL